MSNICKECSIKPVKKLQAKIDAPAIALHKK